LTATALMNRQQFVERIDRAIAQQVLEIERQRRQLEQARTQWRDAHAREAALDNVIDRYREQERKAEERHEQNQIDERMQYRRPVR
jgi:flagellar FliJ protein